VLWMRSPAAALSAAKEIAGSASCWLIYMNMLFISETAFAQDNAGAVQLSYFLRTQAQQARQIPHFAEEN
jgi:hypothetical protein